MESLIPGYNYNIFISYGQKKKEGENWEKGEMSSTLNGRLLDAVSRIGSGNGNKA
jgi:hypothetical protein